MRKIGDLIKPPTGTKCPSGHAVAPRQGDYVDATDGMYHCGKCGGAREVIIELNGNVWHMACICDCENGEWLRSQAKNKAPELRHMAPLPAALLLPSTDTCTLELAQRIIGKDATAKAMRYAEGFADMRRENVGLLLFGPPSCGKTLLACAVSNHIKRLGYTTVITSASRLINELTEVRGHARNALIDEICKRDLVIIDDLGMERSTAFTKELELAFFDTRVRSGKPMAVTTNLGLKDMRECKDVEAARIYGRILENCRPMTLPARDLRAESAAAKQLQAKELLG